MRRTTLFLFALVLAAPAAPAVAQTRARPEVEAVLVGARIRLMAPYLTRTWIGGRMVFADSTTIIIDPTTRRWGKPLALDQSAITRMQISRGRIGSMRNRGLLWGGIAGAAVGAYSAWAVERQEGSTTGGWILVPLFAVGGAGVGGGIGAAIPLEGWDRVALPVQVLYEPEPEPGSPSR
ncbi:MAG TPA: hypothetical protein VHG51_15530 [Longimicrobiaceae bacterium]|nr:hypothetical protein [Longimicrobiaceae bacterium]